MYLTAITKRMSKLEPRCEFVVVESRQFPLPELDGLVNVVRVQSPMTPSGRIARVVYQNTVLPIFLRRAGIDVLLATCNVLPLGCPMPSVVVAQSLQYFDYPEAYGRLRGTYLRAALRYAGRHANVLICVSESARRDLVRLTGVPTARVWVIPHGISPNITGYVGSIAPASPPYILCVATLYRYKNVSRLLQAFAMLKTQYHVPHRLRIVGGEGDVTMAELTQQANSLGIADQVDLVGPQAHERLAAAYAGASVLVYPSLQETFGFPPLEAMALGIPVVASRASSIPEVVGQAAELVDPLDVEDISRGLRQVLLDPGRSADLSRLGRDRVVGFSWDESARQTALAIRSALE